MGACESRATKIDWPAMKRRFELVDGNSAKFWEIEATGRTLSVRFGRLGTDGQTQKKDLPSGAAAAAEIRYIHALEAPRR